MKLGAGRAQPTNNATPFGKEGASTGRNDAIVQQEEEGGGLKGSISLPTRNGY